MKHAMILLMVGLLAPSVGAAQVAAPSVVLDGELVAFVSDVAGAVNATLSVGGASSVVAVGNASRVVLAVPVPEGVQEWRVEVEGPNGSVEVFGGVVSASNVQTRLAEMDAKLHAGTYAALADLLRMAENGTSAALAANWTVGEARDLVARANATVAIVGLEATQARLAADRAATRANATEAAVKGLAAQVKTLEAALADAKADASAARVAAENGLTSVRFTTWADAHAASTSAETQELATKQDEANVAVAALNRVGGAAVLAVLLGVAAVLYMVYQALRLQANNRRRDVWVLTVMRRLGIQADDADFLASARDLGLHEQPRRGFLARLRGLSQHDVYVAESDEPAPTPGAARAVEATDEEDLDDVDLDRPIEPAKPVPAPMQLPANLRFSRREAYVIEDQEG